ncbi:hypothetical protein ONS95_006350 [Cadophora gregata]|uniref:uncharacterized protein n=1 Tax=Cadophora gregata TaxID=51156 RepID=UPI0026DB5CF5|nr:uncharacterized protein ONS95_006350 [Cadophora gregata]KAK0099282.1 hypothetical protein ONS96_008514 [Cadophora gregata f. sp. sojae]KAK0102754.1 hypothetical protein ONS95_006350 [Cadophora gregata]
MDRPPQTLYTPPPQRSAVQEEMREDVLDDSFDDSFADETPQSSASDHEEEVQPAEVKDELPAEVPDYDITMLALAALQVDYGETFADLDVPVAEAFAQRKALKHEMGIEYHRMVTTAIKAFHSRTRCPNCKQTPITIDYFAMNHSMPKGAWAQWRQLCKKMEQQRPEILDEQEWIEFLGEMKTIEMWYWEDNTASVECGRVSWNGNFAPDPLLDLEDDGSLIPVKTPSAHLPRSYGKAFARHGKAT